MKRLIFSSAFFFAVAAIHAQSAAEAQPASAQKSAVLSQQPAVVMTTDSASAQAPATKATAIPAPAVSKEIIIPAEGQKSDAVKKPD